MTSEPARAPDPAMTLPDAPAGQPDAAHPEPPAAQRIPHKRAHHGDAFIDEYAWLAGKDDPQTIAYLEAEKAYT